MASTDSLLRKYNDWVKDDKTGIVAPKIQVRSMSVCTSDEDSQIDQGTERGLFASDLIYPGERILFIPCKALIGVDMIHKQHEQFRAYKQQDNNNLNHSNNIPYWDGKVASLVKSFQDMIQNEEHKGIVDQLGYAWNDDDAVALFLMACRNHLKTQELPESTTTQLPPPPHEQEEPTHEIPVVTASEEQAVESQDERTPSIVSFPSFLPHVAVLPEAYRTSPLFFTAEELARMEGTNCHGFTCRMLQQMEQDWSRLHCLLEYFYSIESCHEDDDDDDDDSGSWSRALHPSHFTLEDYKWALCTVYSRSTDFKRSESDGGGHRRLMAPLLDMMNHSFHSEQAKGGVVVVPHSRDPQGNISIFNDKSTPIEPNQEIRLCYGNFPNEKMLLVYGFVVPNNPYDAVEIYAPLNQMTDPLYQAKVQLLSTQCGFDGDDINMTPHPLQKCHVDNRATNNMTSILPSSLLSVLRLMGIQTTEEFMAVMHAVHQQQPDDGASKGCIPMISVTNEISALLALQQALQTMARKLALNMISDDTLRGQHHSNNDGNQDDLEERDDDVNVGNVQTLCQSEYAILQAALLEIESRLESLQAYEHS